MFRKILLLLTGNVALAVILFVRVLIVARLISVEDFGIAATFMISVTLMQLISNLGLNQMIVQDNSGDEAGFQSTLQGFQVLRGLVTACLLFALAGPMAQFLGQPDLIWAYRTMALVPLLDAFAHFDMFRQQRQMRYGPLILVNTLPALLSVALLWPLDRMFGDYRVLLFAVLAQWGLRLLASHLISSRPYRLSFDPQIMRRGFDFGWPLFLNGILLFFILQGERLVVGRELGMAALAVFSMGLSLVQSPAGSVIRGVHQFLFPQLSAIKAEQDRFATMATVMLQASMLTGAGLSVGIYAFGPPLVTHALGDKYLPVLDLLLALAIIETIRLCRAGLSQVAMARARTGNSVIGNIPRFLALAVAWALLHDGHGLPALLGLAVIGEIAGFALAITLMHRRAQVPLRPMWPSLAAFCLFLGALSLASPIVPWAPAAGPAAPLLVAAALALLLALLGPLRGYLKARVARAYR